MITGRVFNISRCSLHDGTGIRTVVYLAGCSLACRWCHNPEGLSAVNRAVLAPSRCMGCGTCASLCSCHGLKDGVHTITGCSGCGKCCEACPTTALQLAYKLYTPEELTAEIRKDKTYYNRSGGGVTLSGGEVLLQPEFAAQVFALCRAEGIHTAVETALNVPTTSVRAVIGGVDLFIFDIKLADSDRHRQYCGADNGRILENARYVLGTHPHIWVRVPLIPGITDTDENLADIGQFIKENGHPDKVELLKYNSFGECKEGNSFRAEPQTDEFVKEKQAFIDSIWKSKS